jgi:mRNA interferase RelE/StbE
MYNILFAKEAEDFLRKSDKSISERITKKILLLSNNPRTGVPLTANLAGLWKLGIGDYRVIYKIKDQELLILVIAIGHRKNVYD